MLRVESWLSSQMGFLLRQGTQVRFPGHNCLQTEIPAVFINFPTLTLLRLCHFEIMQKTNKILHGTFKYYSFFEINK